MSIQNLTAINDLNSVKASYFDRVAKKQLFKLLSGIVGGRLIVEDGGEITTFGSVNFSDSISAHIFIHHPSAYKEMVFGGSVGASESYMAGGWSSSNLVDVVRLMSVNIDLINGMDTSKFLFKRVVDKIYHGLNKNTESKAKANISAHYDLSNEFFSVFLDPTMMYSAAMFEHSEVSLEQASIRKLDRICQKLQLTSMDTLLEIGTGWGGLAIHAAKNYGCHVTTTTISKQQYDYACQKVIAEGLSDKITVLFEDYRNLQGKFDKLVSIEMIEAVGHEYYGEYFSVCSQRLKPDGLMLIQAITIPDQRYNYAKKSVDFIQKYIFPGGCLPSDKVIADQVSRNTDMQIIGMEEIGEDYALTLKHWRERFHANLEAVKSLGFDDFFIRMWEYYLCYCEGGFRERVITTGQFVLAKSEWRKL